MTLHVLASLTHVRVMVDHTLPTQLRRSAKLKNKDLALVLSINVFSLQVFIFCQKKHTKQWFATLFTHSQPFNEVFIVSSKSRCCSGTFTDILFTSLE